VEQILTVWPEAYRIRPMQRLGKPDFIIALPIEICWENGSPKIAPRGADFRKKMRRLTENYKKKLNHIPLAGIALPEKEEKPNKDFTQKLQALPAGISLLDEGQGSW